MAESKYFHFTLGPVQGFVAQARRTRDFWAGSFLLSWLSGVAMVAVRQQKGVIEFPTPPAHYLDWIEGRGHAAPPRQGSIPNRFKSMRAEVPAEFDGQRVVSAVREAWQALAQHVWTRDQLDRAAAQGQASRAIWERQNATFWDMSWALTDDASETSLLDQRKNWRSHGFTQTEGGVKCMVMDGWQELSGALRPGREGQAFWSALRRSGIPGIQTDLGEAEQLCALAYIKRRFARHFGSFDATLPSTGLRLKGWPLSPGVPSVAYMAAVHWLEALLQAGQSAEVQALLESAQALNPEKSEWDTQIACLRAAVPQWGADDASRRLLALDGNLFFEHVQQQPQAYGYDPQKMQDWRLALQHFERKHPEFEAKPSPFYAILLMDGDSLGAHMSDPKKQTQISNALLNFTNGADPGQAGAVPGSVPEIVERHNGFLIYAGGDDVLAILPLEDALPCAAAVRQHYLNCFRHSGIPTTISAAIEFAHVKTPLGKVLGDAHDLLDNVAKDGAGRDALAVRVWKTSGQVLQWAQPWKIALEGGAPEAPLVVQKLAATFSHALPAAADQGYQEHAKFSSKFFHKIEERFVVLNPADDKKAPVLGEDEALDLLAVDFWASADNRKDITVAQARALIAPLLTQCRTHHRQQDNGIEKPVSTWKKSSKLKADGALLVRFLATKGLEQGDDR
jgi:CRISPR-associated protein Cmr2